MEQVSAYKASDGTLFDSEWSCSRYEERLGILSRVKQFLDTLSRIDEQEDPREVYSTDLDTYSRILLDWTSSNLLSQFDPPYDQEEDREPSPFSTEELPRVDHLLPLFDAFTEFLSAYLQQEDRLSASPSAVAIHHDQIATLSYSLKMLLEVLTYLVEGRSIDLIPRRPYRKSRSSQLSQDQQ